LEHKDRVGDAIGATASEMDHMMAFEVRTVSGFERGQLETQAADASGGSLYILGDRFIPFILTGRDPAPAWLWLPSGRRLNAEFSTIQPQRG
jgi:hypothetical protein